MKGWGICEQCGVYGKQESYDGRMWGHLYFIPLVPEGKKSRVIQQCGKCQHGIHIPQTELPAILGDIVQSTESALKSLLAGKTSYEKDGETLDCEETLTGSVEILRSLQAEKHLNLLIDALKAKGLTLTHGLMTGANCEFENNLDEAAGKYEKNLTANPEHLPSLFNLATLHRKKNDFINSERSLKKILKQQPENLHVLNQLLSVQVELKDDAGKVETYEKILRLLPDLASDKKFMKGYKKSCKKTGQVAKTSW